MKKILCLPKNSKSRRKAFICLRNNTNFDLFINGETRPNRQMIKTNQNVEYYPCSFCKGLYMRKYLKRHGRKCALKPSKSESRSSITASQTLTACAMDATNVISKLNIRQQVCNLFISIIAYCFYSILSYLKNILKIKKNFLFCFFLTNNFCFACEHR